MGKVIIDYEGFKDVLSNYLSKSLIDEVISCMNDNLVFIEDIDEEVSGNQHEKASTTVIATEVKQMNIIEQLQMYKEKEITALKCGCKEYLLLNGDEYIIFLFTDKGMKVCMPRSDEEFVITAENHLICVTGNSNYVIELEVLRGKSAVGYVGTIDAMWYAGDLTKIMDKGEYISQATEEAMREVKKYEKPFIFSDEMITAMRENRNALEKVRCYRHTC